MTTYAMDMTLKAAAFCISAQESSYLFGKEVELHSLQNTEMNGLRGVCRGYVVSTGRRSVSLYDRNEAVAIKPTSLKLVDDESSTESNRPKLFDMQDRLGSVPLLEVYMSGRADVAKILLEYNANIDLRDVDGFSPRSMALRKGAPLASPVSTLITKHISRKSRAEKQRGENTCTNCDKAGVPLLECSKCHAVQYFCKDCQVTHWKSGGHKQECNQKCQERQETVVLTRPPPGEMTHTPFNYSTGVVQPSRTVYESFRKPSNVAFGEQFYVKIQGEGPEVYLMIYDKTREFHAFVDPNTPGFNELHAKVRSDPTVDGRKTYLKCSFDDSQRCTIFLGSRSVKTW
jgi:hypothetical protein